MFLSGYRESTAQCPMMTGLEDPGWGPQQPMETQWGQPDNLYSYNRLRNYSYPVLGPSLQCYGGVYYQNRLQRYPQPMCPPMQGSLMPNLPCNDSRQPWDYSSMCYNVDGQPCQYTNVVDLEDFMNNEKRKEKSRVAAQCRRKKEVQIFNELTAALPARREDVEQLDKASVMRLAIAYLRVRDVVSALPETQPRQPQPKTPKVPEELGSELSYMKALDGFVMVLSQQGDIVYCSENIAEHLGVSQMEIMGQSVYEFSHPCDHEDVRDALRGGTSGKRELMLRLKCTLTGKGRNVHLKSASYKVIRITGHMLSPPAPKTPASVEDQKQSDEERKVTQTGSLIAVGRPIPHPSNIEIPLDSQTFLSKHGLDMKFTYTDDALQNTLGFKPEELVGKSLYDYHHAADSAALALQFKSLFSKGQCETGQYRFLAKTGGYSWVQTQATVITDKQQKPVSVVCVNYVVSGIECKDDVFAAHQVQAELKPLAPQPPVDTPNGAIVAVVPEERPIPVTEKIFAPRGSNMSKGYLIYTPDEGTMFKDEPDVDLATLAPTPGDGLVHLENSSYDDMLEEFILSDNYCSLLGDELVNGSPVDSLGGELLSSPDTQETDLSCEQSSILTEISLDTFDSRSDCELDVAKSPYIPMTDEMPVLETAVMWGALPENVSLARPQPSDPLGSSPAPALQRLLAAPPTGPPPQDLITNIYSDQGLIPSRSISSWDTGVKRVMKQEQEPNAKRAKRSPSPPPKSSSSVLMNLLDDIPKLASLPPPSKQEMQYGPNYQRVMDVKKLAPRNPASAISKPDIRNKYLLQQRLGVGTPLPSSMARRNVCNSVSPAPLVVECPTYPLSRSPSESPARRDRLLSPYSSTPQSSPGNYMYSPVSKLLSPDGVLKSSSDPYLSNKTQASPNYPQPALDVLFGSGDATGFWGESENCMIQEVIDNI